MRKYSRNLKTNIFSTFRTTNPNPASNHTVQDWQRMAEIWAKQSQATLAPGQTTPRTPANRGSPSPMIMESTPADATPLIDEF